VAGRDPRSPVGDLARKQAGKMGSLPATKCFFAAFDFGFLTIALRRFSKSWLMRS